MRLRLLWRRRGNDGENFRDEREAQKSAPARDGTGVVGERPYRAGQRRAVLHIAAGALIPQPVADAAGGSYVPGGVTANKKSGELGAVPTTKMGRE
jgi:hypothetical protein